MCVYIYVYLHDIYINICNTVIRKEILPFVTWIDLESIMISKIIGTA